MLPGLGLRHVAKYVEVRRCTSRMLFGVEKPERVLNHVAVIDAPRPVAARPACHALECRDAMFGDHLSLLVLAAWLELHPSDDCVQGDSSEPLAAWQAHHTALVRHHPGKHHLPGHIESERWAREMRATRTHVPYRRPRSPPQTGTPFPGRTPRCRRSGQGPMRSAGSVASWVLTKSTPIPADVFGGRGRPNWPAWPLLGIEDGAAPRVVNEVLP